MLSEPPPSPLRLRLPLPASAPPPPPPPPPPPLPQLPPPAENKSISYYDSSSESDFEASDGEESSDLVTLDPLPPWSGEPREGLIISSIDDDYVYDAEKEWLYPIFPDEEIGDKACWQRYFQQIHESEGFDIKDYPGCGPMTTIFPMPVLDHTNNDYADYAAQALKLYNEQHGTKYEFNEILKVNGYCTKYYNFYITFTVTNANGDKEYFQAKVVQDIDQSLDFPIVRPRVKGGLDI